MGILSVILQDRISLAQKRLVIGGINLFTIFELIDSDHCCQQRVRAIGINGRAWSKIQMQGFDFFVQDGFRDADRAIRDGLRQAAACYTNSIYQ